MAKIRLVITQRCNRNCEGCCNKQWDFSSFPVVTENELRDASEILITGGEPMLIPDQVEAMVHLFKKYTPAECKYYMYTAWAAGFEGVQRLAQLIHYPLDGIVLTLHEQEDTYSFRQLDEYLYKQQEIQHIDYSSKSLRLNVFSNVEFSDFALMDWKMRFGMEWVDDCPLPDGEILRRFK